MSMIRKAAIGAVILGAGLASTSGVAMATEGGHGHGHGHGGHGGHGSSNSCTNNLDLLNASQSGAFADVAGGAQTAIAGNICDIANDNAVGNDNELSLLGL
jgi:hypothetical protein